MTPNVNATVIGALHIGFARGVRRNTAEDLGLETIPSETKDGDKIRGGGTKIEASMVETVNARVAEQSRIANAFRRSFPSGPMKGTYMLPRPGAGQALLENLDPPVRDDVDASVSEFEIQVLSQAPAAVRAWGERVTRQIANMPLGGSKAVANDVIDALAAIANCPVISTDSRTAIMALLDDARLDRVDRVDFTRKLSKIQVNDVPVGRFMAPRRVKRPPLANETPPEPEGA